MEKSKTLFDGLEDSFESSPEQIVKNKPSENSGSITSNRMEYQMNWGLKKLLELEDRDEDYAIIFDYHDDIVIFNKEENADAVDFYQIKTTDKYYWTLSELYNAPTVKESVKKEKSFLAKLLIHTFTIPSTRNLFFVTNKYVSKSCFDKKPGDEFSFSSFKDESKKKLTEGLMAEVPFIRVEAIEKIHFVTNQMNTNDYLYYMHGLVSDFIKRRYPHADINPDEFYKSIMYEIKRKNNHEKVIDDLWELKEKKSISKSRFHDLVSGMCHLELFKQRQKTVLDVLKKSGAKFKKIDTMKNVLNQFHADLMDYDNISINRIMNEISNLFVECGVNEEDNSSYGYARRLVPLLKDKIAEAKNYEDEYLEAVIMYSYEE